MGSVNGNVVPITGGAAGGGAEVARRLLIDVEAAQLEAQDAALGRSTSAHAESIDKP